MVWKLVCHASSAEPPSAIPSCWGSVLPASYQTIRARLRDRAPRMIRAGNKAPAHPAFCPFPITSAVQSESVRVPSDPARDQLLHPPDIDRGRAVRYMLMSGGHVQGEARHHRRRNNRMKVGANVSMINPAGSTRSDDEIYHDELA